MADETETMTEQPPKPHRIEIVEDIILAPGPTPCWLALCDCGYEAVAAFNVQRAKQNGDEHLRSVAAKRDEIEGTYRPPEREVYPEGSGPFGF